MSTPDESAKKPHSAVPHVSELSDEDRRRLNDKKTQEEYQAAYRRQLQQRFCPGCGDTELF